jgi:ribosome production factor 2
MFETEYEWIRLKSVLVDLFGGRPAKQVDAKGIDRAMVFTAFHDGTMMSKMFQLNSETGKFEDSKFDTVLKLRRQDIADRKTFAIACKVPFKARHKKVKNVETNAMKEKRGRIHVEQQDIKTIALKRRKVLKPEAAEVVEAAEAE